MRIPLAAWLFSSSPRRCQSRGAGAFQAFMLTTPGENKGAGSSEALSRTPPLVLKYDYENT